MTRLFLALAIVFTSVVTAVDEPRSEEFCSTLNRIAIAAREYPPFTSVMLVDAPNADACKRNNTGGGRYYWTCYWQDLDFLELSEEHRERWRELKRQHDGPEPWQDRTIKRLSRELIRHANRRISEGRSLALSIQNCIDAGAISGAWDRISERVHHGDGERGKRPYDRARWTTCQPSTLETDVCIVVRVSKEKLAVRVSLEDRDRE